MKRVILCLGVFASLIFSGGCNKSRHEARAYFWSVDQRNDSQVLFIDGEKSGNLPLIPESKDAEDDSIIKNALLVNLPTGKYELELKNPDGRLLHSGMMEMKKSVGSESLTVSWDNNADCKVKVVYQ